MHLDSDKTDYLAEAKKYMKTGKSQLKGYWIFKQPNYQLAANSFEQALAAAQKTGQLAPIQQLSQALADCYRHLGDNDRLVSIQTQLFYLLMQFNSPQLEDHLNQLIKQVSQLKAAKLLQDYANYLAVNQQYQRAVDYYQHASRIYQERLDQFGQIFCKLKMADLLSMHHLNLSQAIDLYQTVYQQTKDQVFYQYRARLLQFKLQVCYCLWQLSGNSTQVNQLNQPDTNLLTDHQISFLQKLIETTSGGGNWSQPLEINSIIRQCGLVPSVWLTTILKQYVAVTPTSNRTS